MRIGYFHWGSGFIGGGEIFANDVGKALDIPIHSVVTPKENKFGFIDISSHLSFLMRKIRKIRTLDYFTWSSVDVTEFGDFDLILTSGSTTRALITPDDIPLVNIVLSTPRWLYDLYHWRRKRMKFGKELIIPFAEFLRIIDSTVDNRVDGYISISPIIQRRLWKYMKRDSSLLYPPIDTSKYKHKQSEGYFLFLSRLEIEKRPEETIQACINTNQKLVVAGTGTLEKMLRKKYTKYKNIEFTGFISDDKKIDLLSRCEALIYPSIAEDFGIVPIEALASGKPIICSNDGFPPLLIQNKYGITTTGTSESIANAIRKFYSFNFNPSELKNKALEFDFSIFKEKLNERLKFYKDDFDTKFKS